MYGIHRYRLCYQSRQKRSLQQHHLSRLFVFVLNQIYFNKQLSICVIRFVIRSENALTGNCSLIFKPKRQCIVHLFFSSIFSLTIKDKTNILHLRQGSLTRKVRTVFTLKIIVSIFMKLFLILVLHLQQFFIVRILVKRAIGTFTINV